MVAGDALIAEPADEMGGEVSSGCVDADDESMCFAFWNDDGFVIGDTLWSSTQSVTASTSTLLRELLPEALTNLSDLAAPNG